MSTSYGKSLMQAVGGDVSDSKVMMMDTAQKDDAVQSVHLASFRHLQEPSSKLGKQQLMEQQSSSKKAPWNSARSKQLYDQYVATKQPIPPAKHSKLAGAQVLSSTKFTALILIPVMCCMLRLMLLVGRVGLGIVTRPLLRSASSLACLFLFSHVFTGHRALGRCAYLSLLGPAM